MSVSTSRTPLREALKTLASEGWLEILPHKGARVTRLNEEDIDQMFPIMGALEALSGELACASLSEEQFAEIRALHYQMVLHYTRRELAPFQINQLIRGKFSPLPRTRSLCRCTKPYPVASGARMSRICPKTVGRRQSSTRKLLTRVPRWPVPCERAAASSQQVRDR